MDFSLNEEQLQLKATARDLLARECPTTVVRRAMADPDGTVPELYRHLAELGFTGLMVPERFGGGGLGTLDMAVLLEECGYAAMPGPFLFSSALAACALEAGGSDQLKERWLPGLVQGKLAGTVAFVEENQSLLPEKIRTGAKRQDSSYLLTGVKMFVPYAHLADFIVVAARTGTAPDEVSLFVVAKDSPGVKVRLLNAVDQTRRVCRLSLEGVAVPAESRLKGGAELMNRLVNLGAVAIAADSLGGMERALDTAVEYSKVREQFGKPIGSFQALQHMAADTFVDLELGRVLLWYAAHAQDALPADADRAASKAKAWLCDTFSQGSERAVAMHGGIGFTWEHDIHLWYKRARFNATCFGDPAFHRERIARLAGY